ncbi:hypothetical protein [Actinomycetospora chiangmaiensis]|uniref:hypothetical protein n=1 Tax=Actinomycetospora chiangmaiensis TaxID=402650 RepID=UPI00036EA7FE|nr:hypothetical protein [Actinomycetospora chiangmaiensis]
MRPRQETELRRLDLQLAASNEQQRLLIEKELQTGEQRQESYSDIIRSVVLLLVVVTVLVTPLVVMLAGRTTPQDFSQYMAPVTGIAGTVIGYWFSRQGTTSGRTAKRNPRAVPDPPSEAPKGAASPGG